MSIEKVDISCLRLREELDNCGYSMAAASREMGEKSPQRLKDVVSGRQKIPSDLLGSAAKIGVDIFYVLTGLRQSGVEELLPDESALLDNYRHLSAEQKEALNKVGEAMSAGYKLNSKEKNG